jgi:HEAT repeat protein
MDVLRQHESRFSSRGFGQGLEAFGHVASLHEEKVAARDFLAGYLNHPKSTVRTYAMNGLGLLGDTSSIPILEAFTGARDQRVSRAAQQAIGKLRESQPAAPKEVIELRKGLEDLRKESEKLREELKQIRQQLQAQE